VAAAAKRRGAGVVAVARELIRRLWRRQSGRCAICGARMVWGEFHVDHRIPVARGGQHAESNLQLAHPKCNLAKGAR
jgi:5-methylcytosine-specific restriction endonuclease McrA